MKTIFQYNDTSIGLEVRLAKFDIMSGAIREQQSTKAKELLAIMLNDDYTLTYNESGKPFIDYYEGTCSISHSADLVACALSNIVTVGVDIQVPSPKILHVVTKFLSEEEQSYCNSTQKEEKLLILWSVKEAAYKWLGKKGISLKNSIKCSDFILDIQSGQLKVLVNQQTLIANYFWIKGNILSVVYNPRRESF